VNKARPRAVTGFITHTGDRFVWILRVEGAIGSFVWFDSRGISCIHHKFRCPGSIITPILSAVVIDRCCEGSLSDQTTAGKILLRLFSMQLLCLLLIRSNRHIPVILKVRILHCSSDL
jgi:hypothetical protein